MATAQTGVAASGARAEAAAAAAAAAAETLSVIVLTYNEERRLAACLDSVTWADEIVVVDGYSTDGTAALARRYTERVLSSDRLGPGNPGGFSAQRNYALEQAVGDWVLFLDADERVTPELRAEIETRVLGRGAAADNGCAVYRVRRLEHFFGVESPYTHGAGWHDRLLRRGAAVYDARPVHERLAYQGAPGELRGCLLHFSKESVFDYIATMNRYTSLEAGELAAAGAPLPRSPWRGMAQAFCYRYFYMRGYREGTFGLLMCLLLTVYHYFVWAKRWEICKDAGTLPGRTEPGAAARLVGGAVGGAWRGVNAVKRALRPR